LRTWQKILILTLITLAIGGVYLLIVWRKRQNPGVVGKPEPEQHLTADQVAVVRMEFPQHFDDIKDLEGKSVWMKNGYSMPYYPYVGGRVNFSKPAGLLPADQKLDVKKAIKALAPASLSDNIQHGTHQAMVVFTLPTDANASGSQEEFATPVGFLDGPDEHYFCDLLFYYDDPHIIYSNWPKDVWTAIDAHQVKSGMSELQTRTAIGMKMHPEGETEGNRTVDYDVNGKHINVTYRDNHATSIQGQ
jgi:hypothetical protein